ncbi:MAG: ABC transporter substrate-binding protein [Clostridiales bacterium]|jgi:putative aldouronate transport system substrate-binding protein|nr:ABC transporter substrate-binding protein [Clostridiales bacterium]
MKLRKLFTLLVFTAMLSGLLVGCKGKTEDQGSQTTGTTNETKTEENKKEPEENKVAEETNETGGTVRIMMNVTGGKDEDEMKLFQDALSEATGLTIEIEKPASDYNAVLMQKLNGGEQYDLIYINMGDYMNLIDQEALLDITDRVKASDILTGNVDEKEWADITVDGKIYAGFNKKEVHRVVALNKNMLENVGIDYKTIDPSLDGYYQVFKKLKEASTDPEFYPFNAIISETWDLQPWMAAQGLKGGVVIDSDGKKYVPFASDEAAPVWEWFKKLYDEELLDPASFVDKTKDMRAKMGAASQKNAVTVDWAAWVGLHNANALAGGVTPDTYEIVSLPGVKTPDGSYMLAKGGASLFAVPANAQNVDGAIKVLEYFATQEGGELLSVGIEGHDYTVENGKYVLTEIGEAHACDHGAPFPIYKDFKHPVGYNPGVDEAVSYGEYASIELPIPNEGDYKAICGKWGIQIIKGEISALDGLAKMREELVSMGVTDK